MEHLDVPQFLGLLFVMLGAAKLFGSLAQQYGQPAVLGELLAGVVVGKSVLGLVDPSQEILHLLGELGVVILLFSIGIETDLKQLMKVGPAATVVAIVGVALPFALGYVVCQAIGLTTIVSVVVGAAMTATSVGITARVLSDLGRLNDSEGQVILGAAIIDDVIGLVILTVVAGLTNGENVTAAGVATITGCAFGFLALALLIGRFIVPQLIKLTEKTDLPGTPTILALMLAFGLAWLADKAGSAVIIGSFAAGVLIVKTPHLEEIEIGVTRLGHFFVPLFFVTVGASVDVTVLNPLDTGNHRTLLIAGALTVVAVLSKFAAGYAPFWFKGRKSLIGAGMIPRGEVGLIFAQMGLTSKVFDSALFAAVAVVVMLTTFLAPPLLKWLAPARPGHPRMTDEDYEGIEDLTFEA